MSRQLFKELERFRVQAKLSVVGLCRSIDTHTVNYYRWKKAQKITGAYKKIIEDFLGKKGISRPSARELPLSSSDIAVIGLACYYPGASNIKELWENILARRIQFRRMLDQRLPLSEYYDADAKASDKTYLTKAAFLENFVFDWGRLRIPRKTVESTDVAHWLALDVALKTFENAGYKFNEIPLLNTCVIVGNTLTGEQTRSQTLRLRWPYVQKVLNATLSRRGMGLEERHNIALEMEQVYKSAFYPITEDSLAGGLANTIAGRICNYLNLKGGGYIVDGACSSSLLAVATAADALKMKNVDLALAGGVDISLDPFELVGFAKAGALARDKMSVYDQGANGFLPGEGCGFVLLKRLEDALRDKNYIYALIKGWGISSDGKGGIMEPSSSGQSLAIKRAYKDLKYKIAEVDFVEGHGTGTTKGDRVELEGIALAIEQSIPAGTEKLQKCGITSFKSIVGHTKAAAGIGGLIKAVLAVNQRILPPTASCVKPNDVFKDKAKNLYPLIQGAVLSPAKSVRAGISSAGFGGINCHVAVESYDKPLEAIKPKIDEGALFVSPQQSEVFVFTSRTVAHLKKIIAKFKEDLRNISIAEMADLAAFLNKKAKNSFSVKAAIVTDSPEHLYDAMVLLEEAINTASLDEGQIHPVKANDPATLILLSRAVKGCRIGFLYPGQGSQRLNMTRVLTQRFGWARDLLALSKLPLSESIYKSVDQFFGQETTQEFEKQLSDTKITQPAIVLSSLIWTEFLSRLHIEPDLVAGHSLGELTAFYKAGAFDRQTLIQFAQLRGALMATQGRLGGGMVSLFCSKLKAEELVFKVKGNIVLANINSPNQVIVSGGNQEIEKIIKSAQAQDISTHRLNVSGAFHSPLMVPVSKKIRSCRILPEIFKPNGIRLYSGINSAVIGALVNIKEYFSKQVILPVDFVGLVGVIAQECDVLIEVGPGRVLTDLVRAINKGQGPLCLPVESSAYNDRDLNIVLAELFVRNIPVQWEDLYKNRLIRTFVPASRKRFIENQCEYPLKIADQILKTELLRKLPQTAGTLQSTAEIIPGGLPAQVRGKDNIADLLIDLTHQITGFDKESIALNSRLLDDLNLDSIKAAELIARAGRLLGVAGQADPTKLSNNTLGEIRDQLNELAVLAQAGSYEESVGEILKRYHEKTWVRNFILDFKPEEIKTRNVNQLKELKRVIILSQEDEPLADRITREFKDQKIKTQKICYDDKTANTGPMDCLITILPRPRQSGDFDKNSLKEIIQRMHKLIGLVYSHPLSPDTFIVVVQWGGGIASSSAKSLVSTLLLESPQLKVRVIDFDIQSSESEIASSIMDELQTYERFSAIAYDSKLIRKVAYYETSQPADYKKRGIAWGPQDVVIVTGGAKGVSAQCALEFARTTQAQMILVGRSACPKDNKDESNEIVQTLKQFEGEHLKASYYQCDVTDENSVALIIKQIRETRGQITGFIHGAGLNSLKRLKQSSVNDVFVESLPKVMGAVHICRALSDAPPKMIVGITSIIGLTGMEASGWYGLSNEILNLYLHQFKLRHPSTQVVSVAYSIWDEVGMGVKLGSVGRLAQKGIGSISVAEGVKRFRQLVETEPGVEQVIVSARLAGLETWKMAPFKANHFRFIEEIKYFLLGVELIAQAHLNVKEDPYLLDHNWKGSLLFPFVFGLEAMAQAVVQVLGLRGLDHIKARNIELKRPIPVSEDTGATIEIHAQVLEKVSKDDVLSVKVEIYTQESGYRKPHFSAVFELEDTAVRPKKNGKERKIANVLDIVPQRDLYGPILFQGKSFQRIDRIHELCYDEKTKKGECLFTSVFNGSSSKYLTGDPFFIDSVLQSMQLIVSQDACLPNYIEEIEVGTHQRSAEHKLVLSEILRTDMEHYRGDAQAVNSADESVRIKNCVLKILESLPDNPRAGDIVNPCQRDQIILKDLIAKYERELGVKFPLTALQYIPDLEKISKGHRHQEELPFLNKVVQDYLRKFEKSIKLEIKWDQYGKPLAETDGGPEVHLSVTHEHNLILCSVGPKEHGIDIQTISPRTSEEWLSLLGGDKYAIIKDSEGASRDYLGTVVWTCIETFIKTSPGASLEALRFEKISKNDYYILRNGDDLFIGLVVKFSRGAERLLTFLLKGQGAYQEQELNKQLGFEDQYFHFHADYTGPQGKLLTAKKFPVVFKHGKSTGRRVNFSSYCEWIGEIREFALVSVLKQLAGVVETKEWGVATNNVIVDIQGELSAGDIVEGRVWLGNKINDNVYELYFDFLKHNGDGAAEEVARVLQRISWVKILDHGQARVNRLPSFLKDVMQKMEPRSGVFDHESFKGFYDNDHFGLGDLIKEYETGQLFLSELHIPTTLEESNLVGNIYFANYPIWVGRTVDTYFYKIWPDLYLSNDIKNDFICRRFKIDHLGEAMPFDRIVVKMYLGRVYTQGLILNFEIFLDNGKKLAVAQQSLLWVKRDRLFAPSGEDIPRHLMDRILGKIK
ncbi:MAG: SDR family NAD(P)-dependent oxidoreductase [Candidatus Omnitrophica bacterium]|nr:SDR family NAD(P)-dependent oxidoreductase [Candidatus Omnitrophota bacterium]